MMELVSLADDDAEHLFITQESKLSTQDAMGMKRIKFWM